MTDLGLDPQPYHALYSQGQPLYIGDRIKLFSTSPYHLDSSNGGYVGAVLTDENLRDNSVTISIPPHDSVLETQFKPQIFTILSPNEDINYRAQNGKREPVLFGMTLVLVAQDGSVWNNKVKGMKGYISPRQRYIKGEMWISFNAPGKTLSNVCIGDTITIDVDYSNRSRKKYSQRLTVFRPEAGLLSHTVDRIKQRLHHRDQHGDYDGNGPITKSTSNLSALSGASYTPQHSQQQFHQQQLGLSTTPRAQPQQTQSSKSTKVDFDDVQDNGGVMNRAAVSVNSLNMNDDMHLQQQPPPPPSTPMIVNANKKNDPNNSTHPDDRHNRHHNHAALVCNGKGLPLVFTIHHYGQHITNCGFPDYACKSWVCGSESYPPTHDPSTHENTYNDNSIDLINQHTALPPFDNQFTRSISHIEIIPPKTDTTIAPISYNQQPTPQPIYHNHPPHLLNEAPVDQRLDYHNHPQTPSQPILNAIPRLNAPQTTQSIEPTEGRRSGLLKGLRATRDRLFRRMDSIPPQHRGGGGHDTNMRVTPRSNPQRNAFGFSNTGSSHQNDKILNSNGEIVYNNAVLQCAQCSCLNAFPNPIVDNNDGDSNNNNNNNNGDLQRNGRYNTQKSDFQTAIPYKQYLQGQNKTNYQNNSTLQQSSYQSPIKSIHRDATPQLTPVPSGLGLRKGSFSSEQSGSLISSNPNNNNNNNNNASGSAMSVSLSTPLETAGSDGEGAVEAQFGANKTLTIREQKERFKQDKEVTRQIEKQVHKELKELEKNEKRELKELQKVEKLEKKELKKNPNQIQNIPNNTNSIAKKPIQIDENDETTSQSSSNDVKLSDDIINDSTQPQQPLLQSLNTTPTIPTPPLQTQSNHSESPHSNSQSHSNQTPHPIIAQFNTAPNMAYNTNPSNDTNQYNPMLKRPMNQQRQPPFGTQFNIPTTPQILTIIVGTPVQPEELPTLHTVSIPEHYQFVPVDKSLQFALQHPKNKKDSTTQNGNKILVQDDYFSAPEKPTPIIQTPTTPANILTEQLDKFLIDPTPNSLGDSSLSNATLTTTSVYCYLCTRRKKIVQIISRLLFVYLIICTLLRLDSLHLYILPALLAIIVTHWFENRQCKHINESDLTRVNSQTTLTIPISTFSSVNNQQSPSNQDNNDQIDIPPQTHISIPITGVVGRSMHSFDNGISPNGVLTPQQSFELIHSPLYHPASACFGVEIYQPPNDKSSIVSIPSKYRLPNPDSISQLNVLQSNIYPLPSLSELKLMKVDAQKQLINTVCADMPQRLIDAEGGDINKARERWYVTKKWRHDDNIDRILTQTYALFPTIRKLCGHFYHGFDKEGNFIYFDRPGLMQFPQLRKAISNHHSNNNIDFEEILERHFLHGAEYQWNMISSSTTGKCFSILDLQGLGFMSMVSGPALPFVKRISVILQAHYPVRSSRIVLINVPSWFSKFWTIISALLHERTRQKVTICGNDPAQLAETLLKFIDAEQLPVSYGGKCRCPGGCEVGNPLEVQYREFVHLVNTHNAKK